MKTKYQQLLRKCEIALIVLVISLLTNVSYGKDITPDVGQCFDNSSSAEMLLKLENYAPLEQEVIVLKEKNTELDKKIEKITQINGLMEEQLFTKDNTIKALEQTIKDQNTICDKRVEAATTSFFGKVKIFIEGFGIGGVITAIAIILI